jgi:1,4-alpha-glucan branching enzyme
LALRGITETYVPLLEMMEALEKDGCGFRLTMVMTPTLCAMLEDELLQERYLKHLEGLTELTEKEVERTRTSPEFHDVAKMYNKKLKECRKTYEGKYKGRLLNGFRHFQQSGSLEIITCAAHARVPAAAQAHPGRRPRADHGRARPLRGHLWPHPQGDLASRVRLLPGP